MSVEEVIVVSSLVLHPTRKEKVTRPLVENVSLSHMMTSYHNHFTAYSIGCKHVIELIPSVIWKRVDVGYLANLLFQGDGWIICVTPWCQYWIGRIAKRPNIGVVEDNERICYLEHTQVVARPHWPMLPQPSGIYHYQHTRYVQGTAAKAVNAAYVFTFFS